MKEPKKVGSQVEAASVDCSDRTTWERQRNGNWACLCCFREVPWDELVDVWI